MNDRGPLPADLAAVADELARPIAAAVARMLAKAMHQLEVQAHRAQRDAQEHEREFYTPTEVARLARCRTALVYAAIKSGDLPASRGEVTGPAGALPTVRWSIESRDARAFAHAIRHGNPST